MSNPQQPPLPADDHAAQGWYDPAGPQSGGYPVQPYQQPTQPYAPPPPPYAQPYAPQQPYAQPYPPPPYAQPVMPVMPQQNVQVNVIAGRRGVNHGLHLILTILTCGLWAIVWIVVAVSNS